MMVEKESGPVAAPVFPSLWIKTTDKTGKERLVHFINDDHDYPRTLTHWYIRYRNAVTGSFSRQEQPVFCLGGLLADVGVGNLYCYSSMLTKLLRTWAWARA
jgi:hypothetical protein